MGSLTCGGVVVGAGERERSVHYVCVLTFDGPCSSVSKTKAGPDGHLMCTAIYCQSGRGKTKSSRVIAAPSPEVCLYGNHLHVACLEGLKRKHVCITALLHMFVLPLLSHRAQQLLTFFLSELRLTDKELFLGRKTALFP